MVFISVKNDDDTINLAYSFLYEKNVFNKGYEQRSKGDKIISKSYLQELDEVNKLFSAGKTKEFLEELNKNMLNAKNELGM